MASTKFEHRLILPVPMQHNDFNIWSVLKNCVGKELSKITMPVVFNEPLSFLQRMSEYMEYSHLLRQATEASDPLTRLQSVAGFAVSALACNWERLGKPFNPLLGETYELEREEFRIICEQVSHHPPVSAFHAEGPDGSWIFHGSIHPKLKYWGKTVEIHPKGVLTLEFPKWREAYTWTNVQCCVHNVIVGKLWIEQCGTMEIVNHSTGHKAHLNFKSAGLNSKDLHRVEGFIMDKNKQKLTYVHGKWTEFLKCVNYKYYEEYMREHPNKFKKSAELKCNSKSPTGSPSHTPKKVFQKLNSLTVSAFTKSNSVQEDYDDSGPSDIIEGELPKSDSTYSIDIPNSITIWTVNPRPLNSSDYYQFTAFAMSLNELDQELEKVICKTDSRLRPDIRKLEQGDMDGAAAEKTRLEDKQRETNKRKGKKGGTEWSPRWFSSGINPYTRNEDWVCNGEYWKREYEEELDIF